jgi:hypothetical protein
MKGIGYRNEEKMDDGTYMCGIGGIAGRMRRQTVQRVYHD